MAIPFLNHLDVKGNITLNDYKLQDFVVDHSTTGDAGNTTGKLIYDSGTLKYYDGSSWQSLGTSSGTMSSWILSDDDGDDVTISDGKYVKISGVSGNGVTTNWTDTSDGSSSDEYDLEIGLSSVPNSCLANSSITLSQGAGMASMGAVSLGGSVTVGVDGVLEDLDTLGAASADGEFIVATGAGAFAYESGSTVRTSLGLGSLATLSAVNASTITDNSVGAAELNVSGNGTSGQVLTSDGDGTFSWSAKTTNTDVDVNVSNLTARLPQITESVTIGDATDVVVTTSGNLIVTGDLTVSGDTITANVGTLQVEDKNIVMNYHASNDTSSTANGAGLTIQDAVNSSTDATMLWDATNDEFDFSHAINVTGIVTATGTSVFANLDISGDVDVDGTLETDALSLNGTTVSATAAELNYLDLSASIGTVSASEAVVVDANKDVSGFRNVTLTGELDAATGDFSGNVDVDGTLEADAITVNGTALNTVIDNRIKVVQKTATVDVSSLVNNVFKCNIAHGMNSNNLIVKLYDGTTYLDVFADIDRTDANTLQITFASEPSNDIVVVIQEIIGDNIGAGSDITYPSS